MSNRRSPSATLSWYDVAEIETYTEDGDSSPETGDTIWDVNELRDHVRTLARAVRELCVERDRRDE